MNIYKNKLIVHHTYIVRLEYSLIKIFLYTHHIIHSLTQRSYLHFAFILNIHSHSFDNNNGILHDLSISVVPVNGWFLQTRLNLQQSFKSDTRHKHYGCTYITEQLIKIFEARNLLRHFFYAGGIDSDHFGLSLGNCASRMNNPGMVDVKTTIQNTNCHIKTQRQVTGANIYFSCLWTELGVDCFSYLSTTPFQSRKQSPFTVTSSVITLLKRAQSLLKKKKIMTENGLSSNMTVGINCLTWQITKA